MTKSEQLLSYLARSNARVPVRRGLLANPPSTVTRWESRGFCIVMSTRASSSVAGWATIELLILGQSVGRLRLGSVYKSDIDWEVAQLKKIIQGGTHEN